MLWGDPRPRPGQDLSPCIPPKALPLPPLRAACSHVPEPTLYTKALVPDTWEQGLHVSPGQAPELSRGSPENPGKGPQQPGWWRLLQLWAAAGPRS